MLPPAPWNPFLSILQPSTTTLKQEPRPQPRPYVSTATAAAVALDSPLRSARFLGPSNPGPAPSTSFPPFTPHWPRRGRHDSHHVALSPLELAALLLQSQPPESGVACRGIFTTPAAGRYSGLFPPGTTAEAQCLGLAMRRTPTSFPPAAGEWRARGGGLRDAATGICQLLLPLPSSVAKSSWERQVVTSTSKSFGHLLPPPPPRGLTSVLSSTAYLSLSHEIKVPDSCEPQPRLILHREKLRAKLASLFGLDQVVAGHGNEFFQYTAPKQPKKGQTMTAAANQPVQKMPPSATSVGSPTVLAATAVHAYRYTNGQYVKQGKFGAAVLGNHTAKEYRILIYLSQQQPVTAARIHPNFELTVQPNNYSTFYDDQRQNWSMMFESEKAAVDFNKQICIAKCNSISSLEAVLIQDLSIGEGPSVETGDSLEVAYTGWLFQNHGLGQVFDSSVNKDKLLRLKLGSGKVIKGWENGMLGMKKGGKRLLIIPPAYAYGSEGISGHIPSDSTLVFEVEVKRVKFAKDSGSDGHSINSHDSATSSPTPGADNYSAEPVLLPPTSVPFKPGEPAVRTKSNSISEQLSNPDVTKAKLISRMAKMGQPMLPIVPPHLDSNDSEIEDLNALQGTGQHMMTASVHSSPEPSHAPQRPPRMSPTSQQSISGVQAPSAALMPVAPIQSHSNLPGNSRSFQPYTGMQAYAYHQNPTPVTSQLQPVGPMYPGPLSQTPHFQGSADIVSFLMTESRQHNTEIRMAVSKVADKMDHLAAKVEELQKHNASNSLLLPSLSVSMETSMIMSNIQRILQENEKLKQEVLEKNNRIEEQNDKITDLIERNQRYVEQSNLMMEKRNSTLQIASENTQARVLHAEQEKVSSPCPLAQAKVTEELASVIAQVSNLQLKLTSQQKKETDLQMQLTERLKEADLREAQISKLQAHITELQETSEQAQSKLKAEKHSRKQLELKLTALEEERTDLQAEKESLEKTLSERKKKSAQERSQAEEEIGEIRKLHQEELEKLRQLLKQAQVSTDQAAAEQVFLMQAELKSEWEAKCEHLLASAKQEHLQQYQEVCEQKNAAQQKLAHLEEKLSALEQSQGIEKKLSEYQELAEQMQKKSEALQSKIDTLTIYYEQRIQELEKQKTQENVHISGAPDTSEKVKKIMNKVFQSLREEFELEEAYDGRTILSIVMNTIKMETLLLLTPQEPEQESNSEEEEEQPQEPAQESSALKREELKATANPLEQEDKPEKPLPMPLKTQNGVEKRKEGFHSDVISEAEKNLEMLDESVSPGSAGIPSQGIPGPPKTIPPMPPVPVDAVVWEPEYEEARVDDKMKKHKSNNVSEEFCIGLADSGTQRQENEKTLHPRTSQAANHKEAEPSSGELGQSKGGLKLPLKDEGPSVMTKTTEEQLNTDVNVAESEAVFQLSHEPQDSSFTDGDEDDLFKEATLKVSKPVPLPDDEDEDEVSLKGRPPPAPLFGDDDDDDDLDWLG
ncbi:FK506-binding protein 15 [Gracilinanus agilis]|uniref:FK506-binding protein 15 n=1 Tax=Gracilinanus agilis TaxID=191870 RepID=UPI001CFEE30B|nr:FK506-binding protein 15 [Gracilinanus agilis]